MTTLSPDQRGAAFMVLAMAAFAVEDVLFKQATTDTQIGVALLIVGLGGLVIFALMSLRAGEAVWHPAIVSRALVLRTIFELAGRLGYGLALALTPLSSTSAILQAAPLVVTLGAVVFFGERVGWRRWLAMGVGLLGVLIVLRPGLDAFEPASLFAVLGLIGFAGRDLATRASPPAMSTAQLGSLGFAVLIFAGLVYLVWVGETPRLPGASSLGLLAAASVFGAAAYGALTLAMRAGAVSAVAPFRYSRLIFAFLLAYAVFGERPDAATWAGAALIVGAGLYALSRQGRA